jgi:hypothetical protein
LDKSAVVGRSAGISVRDSHPPLTWRNRVVLGPNRGIGKSGSMPDLRTDCAMVVRDNERAHKPTTTAGNTTQHPSPWPTDGEADARWPIQCR